MSIKPEFSLRQINVLYRTLNAQVSPGAFIGRLYFSDFSLYTVTGRKLHGCQVLKDNCKRWHRVIEFVITSYETAKFLVDNCNKSNKFYIVGETQNTLRKMQSWEERGIPMIEAVKVRKVRPALPVEKAALPVVEKAAVTVTPPPEKVDLPVDATVTVAPVQETAIVTSIDDIAPCGTYIPGEVQLASIKSDPASEEQVRDLFSRFFRKNYRRRSQWIKAVNSALPVQYLVSFSKGTKAEKMMEVVIQNCVKAELTVEELSSILAGF